LQFSLCSQPISRDAGRKANITRIGHFDNPPEAQNRRENNTAGLQLTQRFQILQTADPNKTVARRQRPVGAGLFQFRGGFRVFVCLDDTFQPVIAASALTAG